MASYFRNFFRIRDSDSKSGGSSSTKSHHKSRSDTSTSPTKAKHLKYLYAETGTVPPAPLQVSRERSNSLTASRANAPSPLRYTYDSTVLQTSSIHGCQSQTAHHHSAQPSEKSSKSPLYRSSSHKVGERPPPYPLFNPTGSFSSARSSNQSIYSTSQGAQRGTPSRNSSSGSVATQGSYEPRSVLKQNGLNGDGYRPGPHAHVSFQNPNRPMPVHMHPLLSYGRIHRAPISYDVIFPPSSRTVVDRHTHSPIPTLTLTQPATEPPTYGSFTLKFEKIPWPIIARTAGDLIVGSMGRSSGKRFYIGSSSSSRPRPGSSGSTSHLEPITNFDILHAIHSTLSVRVTQQEWAALGNGSRAQRKATQAYEKRCSDMGGGWGAGVRRVDFLGGKTKLVGIEVSMEKLPGGGSMTVGKLVLSRP